MAASRRLRPLPRTWSRQFSRVGEKKPLIDTTSVQNHSPFYIAVVFVNEERSDTGLRLLREFMPARTICISSSKQSC